MPTYLNTALIEKIKRLWGECDDGDETSRACYSVIYDGDRGDALALVMREMDQIAVLCEMERAPGAMFAARNY